MLSKRSLGRDIIKHFTKLQKKLIQSKNTTTNICENSQTHNVQSGVPGQTSVIYTVYTYILFHSIYYDNIYLKFCYRQRKKPRKKKQTNKKEKRNNPYKNTIRIKHVSPRPTDKSLPPPLLLLGKICQRSFLGCSASTSSKALWAAAVKLASPVVSRSKTQDWK